MIKKISILMFLIISFFFITTEKAEAYALVHSAIDFRTFNFPDYNGFLRTTTEWYVDAYGNYRVISSWSGVINGKFVFGRLIWYYKITINDGDSMHSIAVNINEGYLQIQSSVSGKVNVYELVSGRLIYNDMNVSANSNLNLPLNNLNIPYLIQIIDNEQLLYQNSHFNNLIKGGK